MTDIQLIILLAVLIFGVAFVGALLQIGPISSLPEREPLDWTGANRRRRDAKRFNEHLKLFATFMSGLAVAVIITVVIAPAVRDESVISGPRTFMALLMASVLHILGQAILRLWKSEE